MLKGLTLTQPVCLAGARLRVQEERLTQLRERIAVKFDSSNPEHQVRVVIINNVTFIVLLYHC